jgi:cholesterol oxidase
MDFDSIVIGSGFGGAVAACRLAERGYSVLVLERGRRWDKSNYPRRPDDPWLWNPEHPEHENGWLDFRPFSRMSVAAGAAVGGGSIISANVSCEVPPEAFRSGWPQEISFHELKHYSDAVARFMNVQRVPLDHWANRMWASNARTSGSGRFRPLELAISFDPKYPAQLPGDQDNPFIHPHSRRFVNGQGVEQGTCVRLGNCEIGCEADAKNTLDRNYIPWAEKHGAEVRPLHVVTAIEPVHGGYRVSYFRLENGLRLAENQTARIVIVAAGSLGSTELLLQCRDECGTLPKLSPMLGHNWNANGNFLPPSFFQEQGANPPAADTAADRIEFSDHGCGVRADSEQERDVPLPRKEPQRGDTTRNEAARLLIDAFRHLMRGDNISKNMLPWIGPGEAPETGTLTLRHSTRTKEPILDLAWDGDSFTSGIAAMRSVQQQLADAHGGNPVVPRAWSNLRALVTPQPLGGCNMADTTEGGVVNHAGEVFGYHNLYVMDSAIVPVALGANPSRTVGALAERCAALLCAEGR